MTATQIVVTKANPFVPIYSGQLRDAWQIDETSDGVLLTWGKDLDYAAAQYYEPWRHVDAGGGVLGSVADVRTLSDKAAETKAKGSAASDAQKYRRDYQAAKKSPDFRVVYPDGPKWVERAIDDDETIAEIEETLINFFERNL